MDTQTNLVIFICNRCGHTDLEHLAENMQITLGPCRVPDCTCEAFV